MNECVISSVSQGQSVFVCPVIDFYGIPEKRHPLDAVLVAFHLKYVSEMPVWGGFRGMQAEWNLLASVRT